MWLERLTVRGLFAFREAVTLAPDELPHGVIAIVGANGEGKTGLIESAIAAIHREFPTRDKEPAYYTNQREAYIDAIYTLEPHVGEPTRVRARLNLDGHTHKSNGTLSEWDGAAWRPLNDGKITTFTAAVTSRFPSLNILLATAFAAQDRRGSFADLPERDRKDLFQELLGLGQFEAWNDACLEVLRAIEKRKTILDTWRRRIQMEDVPGRADQVRADVATTQAALASVRELVVAIQTAMSDAIDTLEQARATLRAVEGAIAARDRLRDQLAAAARAVTQLDADFAEAVQRFEQDGSLRAIRARGAIDAATTRVAALPTEAALDAKASSQLAAIDRELETEITSRDARINNNRELLSRAEEIRAAGAALTALVNGRVALDLAVSSHRIAHRQRVADQATAAERVMALGHWPSQLAAARLAIETLTTVPFGDKCADAKCSFVTTAIDARRTLPEAEAGVQALDHEKRLLTGAVTNTQAAADALHQAEQALRETDTAIGQHERDRTRDRIARLDAAQDRVRELEAEQAALRTKAEGSRTTVQAETAQARTRLAQDLASATAALDALKADHATADTEARERHDDRLLGLTNRITAAQADVISLQAQVAALDAKLGAQGNAAADVATAEGTLENTRADLQAARMAVVRAEHAHQDAETALETYTRRQAEADRATAALTVLDAELVEWTFLAQATSRDGLPTLEIDAAGPLVSARANDLLATCYGSQRFTIEIVTQDAKAKGGLKEVFEMKVWDAQDARQARDLGDLSGGEKILVDEAVKCALALHVNAHSRTAIRTCFRDETTSALYPDTAMRYLTMLRRVQEAGQFAQLFIVTHNPAVAAQADAQILVADGQLTVRLPPYDDATPWTTPEVAHASDPA